MQEILDKIKPTKEDERKLKEVVFDFSRKIRIKNCDIVVGGSVEKGTWLSGNNEIDVFAMFDSRSYKTDEISTVLYNFLKGKFENVAVLHGSRDYYQISIMDYLFEVIPIMKIKNSAGAYNITDVSPLHAKWVLKNTNVKLRDDIRLMKQFCKACSVYGAESYIRGFSGYVLEILVIHYGGFLKALKAVSKWKDKVVIDTGKFYKNSREVLFSLNASKTTSPLIVIDPVQRDRNASAVISSSNFERFVSFASKYVKKPSSKFFEVLKFSPSSVKGVVFKAVPLEGKKDVVGNKMVKAYEHILSKLSQFKVKKSGWKWDYGFYMWFELGTGKISPTYVADGPFLKMKEHVISFKKKHKKTFVKNGRVFAHVKRDISSSSEMAKSLLKSVYVLERVKKIELVKSK